MRTKKVNNIAKSESESESEILLKQDQQDQECQDSDATTTTTTTTTTTIQTAEEPEVQINITENVVIDTTAIVVEKKKRGRKKLIKPDAIANTLVDATESNVNNGDHVENLNADAPDKKEKKPRKVRTSKQEKENKKQQNLLQAANDVDDNFNDGENNIQEECSTSFLTPESASAAAAASAATPVIHKKRGRKPRGGKIIHENQIQKNNSPEVPNIILHLKCVLSDLKKSNEVNSNKVDNYYNDKKMEILCYNDND